MGDILSGAQERPHRLLRALHRGGRQAGARAITARELGEAFCEKYNAPEIKDIGKYRRDAKSNLVARVYPSLADLPAQSVKPSDVERMRANEAAHLSQPGERLGRPSRTCEGAPGAAQG